MICFICPLRSSGRCLDSCSCWFLRLSCVIITPAGLNWKAVCFCSQYPSLNEERLIFKWFIVDFTYIFSVFSWSKTSIWCLCTCVCVYKNVWVDNRIKGRIKFSNLRIAGLVTWNCTFLFFSPKALGSSNNSMALYKIVLLFQACIQR